MNKVCALYFAVVVLAIHHHHADANPLLKQQPDAGYENCKNLCNLCNCIGFYCGDECICECHNKTDDGINCIQDMQSNAEKSDTPFEVLIQGPSGSRFVRSLALADGHAHNQLVHPNQVQTFSVYQPNGNRKIAKRHAIPDLESDVAEAVVGALSGDSATIDEKTITDVLKPASMNPSESADDPKVGLGLPLLLPKINAFKAGIGAKLLPGLGAAGIALNPALAPIAIPAKLAALKAKLGLGLLPLAPLI